jgi:hypothetical protein
MERWAEKDIWGRGRVDSLRTTTECREGGRVGIDTYKRGGEAINPENPIIML